MSSSMLIAARSATARLRHEFVAAGFGNQNSGRGGVLLDLLPQPVDVRLQRVRGHPRIVTPDLLQQRFARHRPLPGAIEIAQDRGLLLGQPDLVALGLSRSFELGRNV